MIRSAAIVLGLGCALHAADAATAPPAQPPAAAPAAPAKPAERLPMPPADAITAAAKELRSILKDDFAARDPAARAGLVQKLIELGAKGQPAARCAALREAEDLAAKLGDSAGAETAAGALAATFAIEPADERLRALAACAAGAATTESLAVLLETLLGMSETAVDADDYPLAERAAQAADTAAKRLRDTSATARTRAQLARVRGLGDEWRKVGSASDLLGQPDPAGTGRLGRFQCLAKGAWDKGLPNLAKGDDAALAAAAQAELAAKDPGPLAAAAVGWTDLAAKQPREARDAMLLHAAGLLRSAIPGLDVLERARSEKRLAEIDRQLGSAARRTSLPPGAVLYLSCERDTISAAGGKPVVQDISGGGINGALLGAKPVSGPWGGALEFAGDQSVDCGNPPSLRITGSLTVAMWLRPTALGDARRNPFHKSYGSECTVTIERSGHMNFYWGVSGKDEEGHYQALLSDFPLEANTWIHVAYVRDFAAKTVTWFRNGKRANSVPAAYPAAKSSDQPLIIGRGYAGGFIGMIDEFGVWPRALRDQEIAALHAATATGR